MKITQMYSHFNGEKFLKVHHQELYDEIEVIVQEIDASKHRTKISKEKTKRGRRLFGPKDLNQTFKDAFNQKGWKESRYNYYITLDRQLMEKSLLMPANEQKDLLEKAGEQPIYSYNQTDFVKDRVAVEVQFGKYSFVAYDLFVKHMMFYSGNVINLGIEVLPAKRMQREMSSGIAYFEGEVYNLMRQGRTTPPVPLLILGIEP